MLDIKFVQSLRIKHFFQRLFSAKALHNVWLEVKKRDFFGESAEAVFFVHEVDVLEKLHYFLEIKILPDDFGPQVRLEKYLGHLSEKVLQKLGD